MYGRQRNNSPYYETAQICLRGHVITSYYQQSPNERQNFCNDCGSPTIHQCPDCNTNIQGAYISPSLTFASGSSAPAYCHNCGKPFPWTIERLEAAKTLTLEAEELSEEEKQALVASLPDLTSDNPSTTVAASRWRKALAKMGKHTALAFEKIFVDVASETAKKLLLP